jgi:hypothetical protein
MLPCLLLGQALRTWLQCRVPHGPGPGQNHFQSLVKEFFRYTLVSAVRAE